MNTVVRSPNWIGDGIMALPALRAFRAYFPDDGLTVVVKRYLADIFLNITEIDRVLAIPDEGWASGIAASLSRVRAMRFERGILFTNSFSSALFFRLAGIHALSGYARDARGWLLTDKVLPGPDGRHHQFHYLKIIESLVGRDITRPFPANLVITDEEKAMAAGMMPGLGITVGADLLAIAPAAAYGSAKTWLPERFRDVIMAWQRSHPAAEVVLLGSRAEKDKIDGIAAGLPGSVRNLAGRLTLRQTIVLLSFCRLVICNDSGLMHVAASLGTPLLALFGPTVSGQTSPLGGPYRLLYHGADCAPCRHRECPTDHRCMSAISSGEVLAAAEELWLQPRASTK
jgi:heptosyltransferase-2